MSAGGAGLAPPAETPGISVSLVLPDAGEGNVAPGSLQR